MILKTERLTLRPLEDNDFDALAAILQDERVMTAYCHTFTDADVQAWLARQKQRNVQEGLGLLAVCRKETGEMIGQAGLTYQTCEGEQVLEVGYLLRFDVWHHGYAREAARACVTYAFSALNAPRVHAIVKQTNEPSVRVAQALGMTVRKTFLSGFGGQNTPHFLFAVDREEWNLV